MHPPRNVPFSHSGEMPMWKKIDELRLRTSPYAGICEILIDGQRRGTGWLAMPGLVVTAAHVLQAEESCEMFFPASVVPMRSRSICRIGAFDASVAGSTSDLACIAMSEPAGVAPLKMAAEATPSAVTAIGFPGSTGPLVEHTGDARLFRQDFLAHSAHTGVGHSGCPVFVDGFVVGLHLGDSLISQSHLEASGRADFGAFLNVALALTTQRIAFIGMCLNG
ncbi:trypsin-like serine peptidase [Variovorax sp. LT1R16]|uniref:trypsin-like serine peptidase n=1 Tax=Variovorax sp. LT1R16 TaxID=3443728 RepID=UPI003F461FA7